MKVSSVVKIFATMTVVVASANAQQQVYVKLIPYDGPTVPLATAGSLSKPGWLEASDLSLNVEQTLNIGSQSTGAGAGKITFNPVSFTLAPGSLDAKLFEAAASGTAYKEVEIEIDKKGSGVVQQFTLKLAAVKTIGWTLDSNLNVLKTQVTILYGGLFVGSPQSGGAGWNRVKNIQMTQDETIK